MHRSWPKRRTYLISAVALGLLPLSVSARAAAAPVFPGAAGGAWTIQPSPNQPGSHANWLTSVSCVKNGPCEAVGAYNISGGLPLHEFPQILKGSGGKWARQPSPSTRGFDFSELDGVSCTSANSCLAVGFTLKTNSAPEMPLAERWNGTSWTFNSPPVPAGSRPTAFLDGVSCASPSFCVAVGGFDKSQFGSQPTQPLAEAWNGTSWTNLNAPNPHAENGSEFTAVDCVAAHVCEITGVYDFADVNQTVIAYGLNGTSFTAQKPVNPGGQTVNSDNSVSCTSASACTSAGSWTPVLTAGLAERWNGRSWTQQPTPAPAVTEELASVSCTAATACTAVGDSSTGNTGNGPFATMAMTWNGKSWRLATTPTPAAGGVLMAVSCTAPTACVAVGAAGASTLVEVSPVG